MPAFAGMTANVVHCLIRRNMSGKAGHATRTLRCHCEAGFSPTKQSHRVRATPSQRSNTPNAPNTTSLRRKPEPRLSFWHSHAGGNSDYFSLSSVHIPSIVKRFGNNPLLLNRLDQHLPHRDGQVNAGSAFRICSDAGVICQIFPNKTSGHN